MSQGRQRAILLMLGVALALAVPSVSRAADIPVTTNTDTVAADGLCSLREAVSASNLNAVNPTDCPDGDLAAEDTIRLGAETYVLTGADNEDANASGDLDVTPNNGPVAIEGLGASHSIIDGGDVDRVLYGSGGTSWSIDGVTVRNGKLTDMVFLGGGIFSNAPLTITDSVIEGNEITGVDNFMRGGGIAVGAGSLTMDDSVVRNNGIGHEAGGMGYTVGGGGIAFTASTGNSGTITDSTISGNVVSAPLASSPFPGGGGIHHSINTAAGGLTISRSAFIGNSVVFGGGRSGGAISWAHTGGDQPLRIDNSTFSDNSAGATGTGGGGAISAIGGNTDIAFSSFTGNTGPATQGDALKFQDGMNAATSSFQIRNSALDEGGDNECMDSSIADIESLGGNVERGPTNECTFTAANDGLAPNLFLVTPADNGGPTFTAALGGGTLPVDRVPPASCLDTLGAPVTVDQRGYARVGNCDSGAYELGGIDPDPPDPPDPPGPPAGNDPPPGGQPPVTKPCKKVKVKKGKKKRCKKKKKKRKKK